MVTSIKINIITKKKKKKSCLNHLTSGCVSLRGAWVLTVAPLPKPTLPMGLQRCVSIPPLQAVSLGRLPGRVYPAQRLARDAGRGRKWPEPRGEGRALGLSLMYFCQQHSHPVGPTHPLYSSTSTTQQREFQFSLDFHVSASRKIAILGFVTELSSLND